MLIRNYAARKEAERCNQEIYTISFVLLVVRFLLHFSHYSYHVMCAIINRLLFHCCPQVCHIWTVSPLLAYCIPICLLHKKEKFKLHPLLFLKINENVSLFGCTLVTLCELQKLKHCLQYLAPEEKMLSNLWPSAPQLSSAAQRVSSVHSTFTAAPP